ncbi:MAG: tRNA lysidine(34) synthetase TilS [Pseudomonadota bacterium]
MGSTLNTIAHAICEYVKQLPQGTTLNVGFSGGMDSTVLLHALWYELLREPLCQLRAIYVDHGLQPLSSMWGEHCRDFCETRRIPFVSLKVDATPKPKQSPEEAARIARYHAFAMHLKTGEHLVTGHHQNDQAETFLLNVMRGSGVSGLAAMPLSKVFKQACHDRPLLHVPYKDLQSYAEYFQLTWVDDPSNNNKEFDRNFLRHHILPQLQKRWPAANPAIVRTSQLCADDLQILQEIAQQDLSNSLLQLKQLTLTKFNQLSVPRKRNLLRYWFKSLNIPTIPKKRLDTFLAQSESPKSGSQVQVSWKDWTIRVYKERIYLTPRELNAPKMQEFTFASQHPLGHTTHLLRCNMSSKGLRKPLKNEKVTLRFRKENMRVHPESRGRSQTLKKLFQEYQVEPWMRDVWPLIFYNDTLVAAPNLWITKGFIAEPGYQLSFEYE